MAVKFCEGCGKEASPDARFCGGCRREFPEEQIFSDVEPDEPEAHPLTGRDGPANRGGGGGGGDGDDAEEQELYLLRPLAVQTFAELGLCIITVGIGWLFLWLRRIQEKFRITNERIEISTGVFHVTRHTIEIFRVQDLELQEPAFLRLRGAGNLLIRSMDAGEPEIILRGLADAEEVHESLRRISLTQRQKKRVRLLEGME